MDADVIIKHLRRAQSTAQAEINQFPEREAEVKEHIAALESAVILVRAMYAAKLVLFGGQDK